ncbi:2,3-diaminopropionate biosynthesis protein SbnA [Paenibacillus sp. DMB20]|uniref:2,3-diaminopropionate biosynthesis protein SbnA n=1 Tax=Paenibacillus sp. DMB20 TaxID=1642570 RepID=UPI00062801BE|nr:2,3-diaminopropionate biosynthesis protein SbnA [Paenibacillus sp. DMB20]KKO52946.1 cysteine synthase [Paenibacillus sp. DMB20]KKO53574.1 cysteine synthase [Paenibacillus sp. DMB20]
MKLEGGIVDTIGDTPLIRLSQLFQDAPFDAYAKLEGMNPGGSGKDRPALYLLKEAIRRGDITERSVVVESSSGNLAISLAQLCRYLGLRFICVVDPRTTEQHKSIIRGFGGEIDLVSEPDEETGEFLPARIRRVKELVRQIPHAYWTNQYGNLDNSLSHTEMTMKEICDELGPIDYLFCGVSSCGTIRGCSDYIRSKGQHTKIVAVDAAGSVIFGGKKSSRRFPGLGAGIVPGLYHPEVADEVLYVSDRDCVEGCRLLVRRESIMAGASSGGVISAMLRMKARIPKGAVCAAILPDRGERYMDTVYNDDWVRRELGFDPRLP